jgi:hypothetical protein
MPRVRVARPEGAALKGHGREFAILQNLGAFDDGADSEVRDQAIDQALGVPFCVNPYGSAMLPACRL